MSQSDWIKCWPKGRRCLERMPLAGAESTRGMAAAKGRASNQPDKVVGHLDPGAVTMAIQLECLADYLEK
ncbi:MAG: dihydroxyacetone kinase subunit L [Lachnospiraceae bacterium]|nr:dihydroxyacetone kinase subunit L [Lachnospiraceae bacterium]